MFVHCSRLYIYICIYKYILHVYLYIAFKYFYISMYIYIEMCGDMCIYTYIFIKLLKNNVDHW